jgi:OmpA-OmpF porin, OOP family
MKLCRVLLVLFFVCSASALAQETPFTVQLTGAISAQSSHKGDPVGAHVVSPEALKGDMLEGKITDSGVHHGHAELLFTFDTLMHGGQSIAISSTVTSITNSKGQQGVDEEGNPVETSTASPEEHHHSHFGSALGGMIGGATGAEIGGAADTAASLMSIKVSAKGSSMTLDTGSTIGLNVKSTGGEDLASLAPNQPAEASSSGGQAAAGAGASQAAGGEPNLVAAKMDFVPGEKTIFFDDFHDMPPGEPPPHWAVRDTSGPVELHMGGGVRELWIDNGASLISPKLAGPANFTAQLRFVCHSSDCYVFMDFPDYQTEVEVNNSGGKLSLVSGDVHGTGLSSALEVPLPQGQLAKVDFWMQNGRARVYLNGKRVVDINQVSVPPFDHVKISAHANGSGDVSDTGIRSFRLAESVPDLGAVLETTGKYVTHGIYFDTDSATLKPESAGVIQEISAALYKHQDMKLEIDGYTDSTGDAAHNLDLSKRRAEAVMNVLVSQFGIDASRLTSNGFGAGNPIASNDTPDGRAENRRVEFVKK